MNLNWVETLAMNNPVRSWIQRHYEAPHLLRLLPEPPREPNTLVIGCGRGVDAELAFDVFRASAVTAFDFDPNQVERARHRLGSRYGDRLTLTVADAAQVPFDDNSFDLVLDFGIVHHIPNWRDAVGEVFRVLKPGGWFVFEEIPKRDLDTWFYRALTAHPREDRFNPSDFRAECERAGFAAGGRDEWVFPLFRGVAQKPG